MKTLSSLDAAFLYLETPEMPMHVGALNVFELPANYKGRFVRDLRKHVASRLPVAPALRRKLWWMPLNFSNPAWVDADPDLEQHIVEVKLPASARRGDGSEALEAQVAALHTTLLDRRRPLWKFHVFEGLGPSADGHKRVALYSQLHHAAVDGQAAVALAAAILDVSAEPRAIEARPKREPTRRLSMGAALRGALAHQISQVSNLVKELPSTVGTLGGAARTVLGNGAWLSGDTGNLTLAPKTPFNASVTNGRAFAGVSLPLAEFKALGKAHGATVNDMVMMVCSTALRRQLSKARVLPKKSLIAAVPISLRESGDTSSDNQASLSLISLGTHIADPARRLAHICAASRSMKATLGQVKSVLPTDFPSLGLPWLIEAAASLYGKAKVADRLPQVANVVISNVPGPSVPLYMAGARMVSNYPTSIVVHGLALNVTVQSYNGALDFGLMTDAAAWPDAKGLAQAIEIAFDDVRALPLPEAPEPPTVSARVGDAVRSARGAAVRAAQDALGGAARKVMQGAVQGVVLAARTAARKSKSATVPSNVNAPATARKAKAPAAARKPAAGKSATSKSAARAKRV